eukprot:TRINITY_DN16029_c0_g2_i1.p3 TRINITY_DN16029_c0_g2~~TRINITY_DN16029_c0_g2_i1.p3  ORF type:complete len:128 (-),score=30.70 TRINITY_DN16029_c0_g2_i1:1110-1493(-)
MPLPPAVSCAPVPEPPVVTYSGYLLKKGGTFFRGSRFQRRFFVLRGNSLHYFMASPAEEQDDQRMQERGFIDLRDSVVQIDSSAAPPNRFTIEGPFTKRRFELAAFSEADRRQWMDVLAAAVRAGAA